MTDPDIALLRAFMHSKELRTVLDYTHAPSYTQPWETSLDDLRQLASTWGFAVCEVCPDDKQVVFTNKRSRRGHPAFVAVVAGAHSAGWPSIEVVHYPHRTLELVEANRGMAGSGRATALRREAEGEALRHVA